MSEREKKIYMARLAEQAKRWEDMTEYMIDVVKTGLELSQELRILLSTAFKNVFDKKRKS